MLQVGDICRRKHYIAKKDDLIYRKRKEVPSGMATSCKACKVYLKEHPEESVAYLKPLAVGDTCRSGRHFIADETMLVVSPTKAPRCRKCGNESSQASRKRLRKERHEASIVPVKGLDILKLGRCSNDHRIRSKADVFYSKKSPGKPRCRACQARRGEKLDVRRWVIFECTHQVLFESPLPAPRELTFCMPCREYRIVEGYGNAQPKDSHVKSGEDAL